jgi:hypothetical protein
MMDFGCGKGFDADFLGVDGWDPYYRRGPIHHNYYKIVTCHYVLNVLPLVHEASIIDAIEGLLTDDGEAYISVRRDIEREGETKINTFQRLVYLPFERLHEDSKMCIYRMKK